MNGPADEEGVPDGAALFERDGSRVVPTNRARGPWRPDALHGAAVAGLLACGIDVPGRTPARVVFDLLAPVRTVPMTLSVSEAEGGKRVVRQTVTLLEGDVPVARAQCLAVRRAELELPEGVTEHPDPFAGEPVPDLSAPAPSARRAVGWECFDNSSVSLRPLRSPKPDGAGLGLWVDLLVPVIAGEPTPGIARAAVAADYASVATNALLPFGRWSFMNAELSLHLSRDPVGSWVGLVGTGVLQPHGCGLSVAALYDSGGRLGQSAQALVLEERQRG
ncbi:acyl-CoA thioesterase domain-containing protein [Actinocorallia libanotica]|uniref:Thioesterase superfamily protein n=1 Tax=Actinocorallia libanotica TaxID=46162 RepID=A0ABP4C445_9ACTN